MRLQHDILAVNRVVFGSRGGIEGGVLMVEREELCALLASDPRLQSVDVEVANPGEPCRIVNVFDVMEPRIKVEGGPNFPGVIEPIARVGIGRTRLLRGATVVALNAFYERFNAIIDMAGVGAELCPYARTANICIAARPAPGVERPAYYRALKEAALKAGVFLARSGADAPVHATETYDLDEQADTVASSSPRPRVAYVFMLASQQRPTQPDEPVLYGDNVRHLLPTILHPNELLDGAVLCPYWNFGTETYFIQNHPIVLELYRGHGKALDFAGVVVTVAHVTETERRRSVLIAANLVKTVLRADGVLLTKVGGGIPESDLMATCEACENLGVRTTIVVWTHGADRRVEGSLTVVSPRADAMVSVGMIDESIELASVERVIGGPLAGPFSEEAGARALPAAGALRVQYRDLAGVINQIGAGRVSIEEY
jgi:glycine reductase